MNKSTLARAIVAGIVTLPTVSAVSAAGFIEDSKASLGLRNFYYNQNTLNEKKPSAEEWGQGFLFNYQSGYTQGTVGFGADALALAGVRLDGGGRSDKAGRSRTPGQLFPLETDNSAVDSFGSLGLTGKARISKTELRLGTLQPKLPVVTFNDGRLLPQTFEGGQLSSTDIDNLTLIAGQLEHTKTRASSNQRSLAISGAGATADSNQFRFAGGDYKLSKELTAQYYYGELENFYRQHFLGLQHSLALGGGTLKTDLRYFDSNSDGDNGSLAGRAAGYTASGYYGVDNKGKAITKGEVDNQTWSALLTWTTGGHSLSGGYQQVSGDSAFPFLNQGDGATAYLITDRQIGKFLSAGERTWLGEYGYDFGKLGVPGLKASATYLSGDNIDNIAGDRREWERDLRLDYSLQGGPLKGLAFSLRNASLRGNNVSDQDENRVIVSYSLPLL